MSVIGVTSGCFDLIHFGHLRYLERCRGLCDRLIVGVDSDALVRTTKGASRPIVPEGERLALVNALRCVDAAFFLHAPEDLHTVTLKHGIHKVFKHQGFRKIDPVYGVTGTNAELVIVPDLTGISHTTEIIDRLKRML